MTRAVQETSDHIQKELNRAVSKPEINRAMEIMLRLGFVVRGVIYGVIGLLALQAAFGGGGKLADPQGAIATIGDGAFGNFLLFGILVGLVSYGAWGLVRAIFDPFHKGHDAKGVVSRLGFAISGFSYLSLGYATYNLIMGRNSGAHNGAQGAQLQQTASSILSKSWGPWVIGLVALAIIGSGVAEIIQSFQSKFDQQFNDYTLKPDQKVAIVRLGRFGTFARGFVSVLLGLFFFLAAFTHNPGQAKGLDGVLATLMQQPFGIGLLGVVALGLIAFGIYSIMSGVVLKLKSSPRPG